MKGKHTQVPSQRMSILVLLYRQRQFHAILLTVPLIPQSPDGRLNSTAIDIFTLYALMDWNNKLGKVHCIHLGVIVQCIKG